MFYIRFLKLFIEKMSESLIFAHFLFFGEQCEWIAHFAQIKWAMWVNGSFRSPKMSDYEWFAQIAQRKWGIVRESLRSLTKNKRMRESLIFLSESLIFSFLDNKRAIHLEIKWANSQPWKVVEMKPFFIFTGSCCCILFYVLPLFVH